jgi:hypothetical protein
MDSGPAARLAAVLSGTTAVAVDFNMIHTQDRVYCMRAETMVDGFATWPPFKQRGRTVDLPLPT